MRHESISRRLSHLGARTRRPDIYGGRVRRRPPACLRLLPAADPWRREAYQVDPGPVDFAPSIDDVLVVDDTATVFANGERTSAAHRIDRGRGGDLYHRRSSIPLRLRDDPRRTRRGGRRCGPGNLPGALVGLSNAKSAYNAFGSECSSARHSSWRIAERPRTGLHLSLHPQHDGRAGALALPCKRAAVCVWQSTLAQL